MTAPPTRATGRCLCGGVSFSICGPLRSTVTACHCRTCRRFSGGLFAGTVVKAEHLEFRESGSLKWYQSSEHAQRGFCGNCGSSLFWREDDGPFYSIAAGSLDEPTGLKLACHGWTVDAADYWDFSPNLPIKEGPSELGPPEEV